MMIQYWAIKKAHPDCLLFYRMGDFYEMFFDDAVQAAAALDITLTKRGRHEGEDIPMCGVPIHNYEPYLNRLVGQGFRIAVCEQLEDPAEAKRRGGKSVVNRDVVRIFTKGTLVEDTLLDARANNFLAALAQTGGRLGLAWCDLSTGALNLQPVAGPELAHALDRLDARELLVPERLIQNPDRFELFAEWRDRMTVQPDSRFDSENGRRRLEALYQVGSLAAFGNFSRAEIAAAGALVGYIDLTQKGRVPRLSPPSQVLPGSVMQIDGATRRNLELNRTLNGERRGSLLACLDRTMTAVGARLLATRLAAPLTSPEPIRERLAAVGFWMEQEALRTEMRQSLRGMPDIERALSRLALGRGGPRDLATIRDGLIRAGALKVRLGDLDPATLPPAIAESRLRLGEQTQVVDLLARALVPEPPVLARDGGFIAAGYAPAIDLARTTKEESRRKIALLQAKYAGETGIASLKVRHNSVLGYHIEVTAAQADKLMTGGKATGAGFIHRQTTANSVRFSTVALGELEQALSSADSYALGLELEAFAHLVASAVARGEAIAACALGLAELDVSAALAELAAEADWCRPVVDAGTAFAIEGGRHPVVEAALAAGEGGERFVPNDCNLAPDQRLWLITGPNMAGKSTYLRQNALIAVLAQIGSYVPATSAHIGVVDRLFSRVGAADDLARGRSTFMVEMLETAAILNQAGPRALVILDEIGRGTATFDGLSIAWACVEHLHEVTRCRALFATHYHELTRLAERLQALACHTMRVKEWQGEVVFLHEITVGTADRSYGIHVARLAGLPPTVIARAQEVLDLLETGDQASVLARLADDLPLFQAAAVRQASERRAAQPAAKAAAGTPTSGPASGPAMGTRPSDIERALAAIDPDALTPRDALEQLYRLRAMLGET